jgi:hypothetical protein
MENKKGHLTFIEVFSIIALSSSILSLIMSWGGIMPGIIGVVFAIITIKIGQITKYVIMSKISFIINSEQSSRRSSLCFFLLILITLFLRKFLARLFYQSSAQLSNKYCYPLWVNELYVSVRMLQSSLSTLPLLFFP